MRLWKILSLCLIIGHVVAVNAFAAETAKSAPKNSTNKAAKKEPSPPVDPPTTTQPIVHEFKTIPWGMAPKDVALQVDKLLDQDYAPLYKGVSSAIRLRELDTALAEDKAAFRRSRVEFGVLPTGVDATALKGEYTYQNKEEMMTLQQQGQTTYFFFIQSRLWKIIEEQTFGEQGPGKNYADAIAQLNTALGVEGRALTADPQKGRTFTETDWKDVKNHLRAIDRGASLVAFAYEDNATLANLAALRPNKPTDESALDPAVQSAIRKNEEPAPAPTAKGKTKPKK